MKSKNSKITPMNNTLTKNKPTRDHHFFMRFYVVTKRECPLKIDAREVSYTSN